MLAPALQRLTPVIVSLAALAGVAGGAVALHERGGADLFRLRQSHALSTRHATVLGTAPVQAVVAQAPEPVASAQRTPVAAVRCRAGLEGALRNPWSCTVGYRSGRRAHYRVVVQPDGEYKGLGAGVIEGCCVAVPTLE